MLGEETVTDPGKDKAAQFIVDVAAGNVPNITSDMLVRFDDHIKYWSNLRTLPEGNTTIAVCKLYGLIRASVRDYLDNADDESSNVPTLQELLEWHIPEEASRFLIAMEQAGWDSETHDLTDNSVVALWASSCLSYKLSMALCAYYDSKKELDLAGRKDAMRKFAALYLNRIYSLLTPLMQNVLVQVLGEMADKKKDDSTNEPEEK